MPIVDEIKFNHSWSHDDKSAKIKSIYLASRQYRQVWSGTALLHISEWWELQETLPWYLAILRQSFRLKYADDEGVFGPGIYSTPNSSKADVYAKNHYVSSNLHAMLICYVVATKPQRKLLADHSITRPSSGYNCIEGVTIDNGGSLQYPEFVVYREDAIIPVGLIMYTRKGWEPL
ncbi:hypothetical protein FMUND_10975 [Fusarium mundagurra]|uniref:PARP catalytic domain-containing protein n=1 Tax=Fusarium mundagurra TaxID=1567541 RepID=A0A8H6DA04_9HYPO|nr:hypothetical protein FMUND_10975 [Fusarium mundagurra]